MKTKLRRRMMRIALLLPAGFLAAYLGAYFWAMGNNCEFLFVWSVPEGAQYPRSFIARLTVLFFVMLWQIIAAVYGIDHIRKQAGYGATLSQKLRKVAIGLMLLPLSFIITYLTCYLVMTPGREFFLVWADPSNPHYPPSYIAGLTLWSFTLVWLIAL